jgi:hypothetical protein
MVCGLYESAVNEPVPEPLVRRIPDADQTIPQGHGPRMPVQNVPRVRENFGVLHRLLNFQESKTKGQRITKALDSSNGMRPRNFGRTPAKPSLSGAARRNEARVECNRPAIKSPHYGQQNSTSGY